MDDEKIRRGGFQRDRTFTKFETNRRRWSAFNDTSDDSTIHNRLKNGRSNEDECIGMLSYSNINLSNSSAGKQDTTNDMHSSVDSNLDAAFRIKTKHMLQPLQLTASNRSAITTLLDLDAEPLTPEPALLGVKQKLILFENLKSDEWLTITPARNRSKALDRTRQENVRRFVSRWEMSRKKSSTAPLDYSIDKSPSEDEENSIKTVYDVVKAAENEVNTSQGMDEVFKPSVEDLNQPLLRPTSINYLSNGSEIAKVVEDSVITKPKPADLSSYDEREEKTTSPGYTSSGNASNTEDSWESSEGEFEPSAEAVNKPILPPAFTKYLGYDHEEQTADHEDLPDVIEVEEEDEADIIKPVKSTYSESIQKEVAVIEEELKEEEVIIASAKPICIQSSDEEENVPQVIEEKQMNLKVEEVIIETVKPTYFQRIPSTLNHSVDEELSEDEVIEYPGNDEVTQAINIQNSVTSPMEEIKQTLEIKKPFLSPAFIKYMGFADEPFKVDEREQAATKSTTESLVSQDDILDIEKANEDNTGRGDELMADKSEAAVNVIPESYLTPPVDHYPHNDIHKPKAEIEETTEVKKEEVEEEVLLKPRSKDISRNYRSLSKYGAAQTLRLRGEKYKSLQSVKRIKEDKDQLEICAQGQRCIQPILDELIKTEQTYVESLWTGLYNYGNLFEIKDLPRGLKGKKYVLFGNIEQIAEFHRDEFLPMLLRNRHDLKILFDEFQQFIEEHCFYAYVLYAMNNQRSLELCNSYKKYFKLLQTERNDNLGINSFLLQPIQRVARYPLLLREFIKKLFDNYPLKPIIDSCCRLDKKMQDLLNITNKSEVINDIASISETHEFNIFYQGKFREVGEFQVHDHTHKRTYRSKVFAYDKCIIYTEIKRKAIIFRGRYPREHIGISGQAKSFTLFYERRKQQECDFMGDSALIKHWYALICDIISAYAEDERTRLKQLHSRKNGDAAMLRPPVNLLLFRDSNRFSTDSGLGNITPCDSTFWI